MSFAVQRRPDASTEDVAPHPRHSVGRGAGEASRLPSDATRQIAEQPLDTLTPARSRSLRRALDDLAAQRERRRGC
jgi:hypothetical protein